MGIMGYTLVNAVHLTSKHQQKRVWVEKWKSVFFSEFFQWNDNNLDVSVRPVLKKMIKRAQTIIFRFIYPEMGAKEKICVVCEESFRTEDGQLKAHQVGKFKNTEERQIKFSHKKVNNLVGDAWSAWIYIKFFTEDALGGQKFEIQHRYSGGKISA